MAKATALVHSWQVGNHAYLEKALERLSGHHSLHKPLNTLAQEVKKKGIAAHDKWL